MRKNSVSLLGGERFFALKILYGHGRRPEVWNESGLGDKTLVVRFARQMSPGVIIHAHFNSSEKWTERES